MHKVLIVGNQGYIGSRLAVYLSDRGFECSGIDTGYFAEGTITNSQDPPTQHLDARDITAAQIANYDSVVMLAGISNDPFGNLSTEQIYDPAAKYALDIAKICKMLGKRYIFPSSCSVYGAAGSDNLLNESSKLNPQTPYSVNKVQVEQGLRELSSPTFTPYALRFGTIYGMSPRIRFDVVINMLVGLALTSQKVTLNSDGKAWRPHLHIDDACQSILHCLNAPHSSDGLVVLNVGQNIDNLRIIDVANYIVESVPGATLNRLNPSDIHADDLIKDRKIQDGVDTRTYRVSFDAIHDHFPEFRCNYNVKSGILQLIDDLSPLLRKEDIFKKREFYRLQHIEYLHSAGLLNDVLRWVA